MEAEIDRQADIMWRMAPWLTLAAMTMTVLSYSPAETRPHHHEAGAPGMGCANQDQDHAAHPGGVMEEHAGQIDTKRPSRPELS